MNVDVDFNLDRTMRGNSVDAFFALLRAGLFPVHGEGLTVNGFFPKDVDWGKVYQLAAEQSVLGLVLQGIEAVQGSWLKVHGSPLVPQMLLLQWIGEVQLLEQRNLAMNRFVAELVGKMRAAGIYAILVKGQGVAQCYEKSLWRACGDVDLYLSDTNFAKAKAFFRPLVESFDPDTEYAQHINMHYGDWVVEIHANQHCSLSTRIDCVMDEIHRDIFNGGRVRSWDNGGTLVFLPSPDNDVLMVFTHFLKHFYKGGLGVRQICDWCRLLYRFRSELDLRLLESRLKKMGLMNVWRGFGAFAVEYLGMPADAMPFLNVDDNANVNRRMKKKADRICSFVMEVGNFGHNRDSCYYDSKSKLLRKAGSFKRRCVDIIRHARIFPLESLRFFPYVVYSGFKAAAHGE